MKHNRNYQRIDNAIIDAYKELLRTKGSPDASITELCEIAKVNRTTFYKHYRGIYEIIDKVESDLIYELFNLKPGDDLKVEQFFMNPRPVLEAFNNNLLKDLEYYKHAFRSERSSYIVDRSSILLFEDFKKHFPKYTKNEGIMMKVKLNISAMVGIYSTLYIQWLNGLTVCELKDITEYISKVVYSLYKDAKIPE